MPRQAEDLSGKKFNYLTVIERDYNYPAKGGLLEMCMQMWERKNC